MSIQDTASKTELLLECSRPFDPEVEIEAPEETPEATRYGSAWHEALARKAQAKDSGPRTLEKILAKWQIKNPDMLGGFAAHVDSAWQYLLKWPHCAGLGSLRIASAEKPLATLLAPSKGGSFDVGFEVESRECDFEEEGHHYDLRPGEFGGTADLVLEGSSSKKPYVRIVIDYKSGEHGDFSAGPKTPQLLSLALATEATHAGIFHYPRNSLPELRVESVSPSELADFARKRLLAMSRIGDGSLRPGPWCNRCLAKTGCPAHHAELVKITSKLAVSMGTSLTSEVDPGRFHQTWGQIEKLVRIAKDQIKERVASGEVIERPDGKVLSLQETKPYETLSLEGLREALGAKAEKEITRLRRLGALKTVSPGPKLVAK